MGGSEGEQWLLALARNADEPVDLRGAALRRRAIQVLGRSNEPRVRDARRELVEKLTADARGSLLVRSSSRAGAHQGNSRG